jgi:phytoene dehydrogenase-like protein
MAGSMDVVIIGAGHNGLTASIVLAMRGLDVVVIDHLPWYGGMAGSKWLSGARIPVGAYVIGLVPREILDSLGIRYENIYPDPLAVYLYGETIVRWWNDKEKRFSEFETLGIYGAREMWSRIEDFHRALRRYIFRTDPPDRDELLKDPVLRDFIREKASDFLSRYIPRWLWDMFIVGSHIDQPAFLVGYYNAPEGWYIPSNGVEKGSWVLVDELYRKAVKLGVRIYMGVGVKKIAVEGRRVRGVILEDGSRVEARYVISTASPLNTLTDLLDPGLVDDKIIARLEKGSPRIGLRRIAIVYREKPRLIEALKPYRGSIIQTPLGEILFGDNYIVATGGFGIDDLREISPDILDKAVAIEIMDSRDIERIFRVRGGVVNHIAMTEDFLYSCRPACGWGYRTPIEGLYLGGAGTWPGGQVTCIPGWNAAHKLIQDIQIESRDSKY